MITGMAIYQLCTFVLLIRLGFKLVLLPASHVG